MVRSFGPPLRFRLHVGDLQFFNGQGWISVREYIRTGESEEDSSDLAEALEEAQAEPEEENA